MPARSPKIAGEKPKNRRGPTKAEIAGAERAQFDFAVSGATPENLTRMARRIADNLYVTARSKRQAEEIFRLQSILLMLQSRQEAIRRRGFC